MSGPVSAPRSTYRLQIHAGFTLFDAAQILGYLQQLGADAVYLSPLLRATKGSNHGYDLVDHAVVDPDRGGDAGLRELVAAAAAHGLPVVVDIVPNHMGVADAAQNRAWWEFLRLGREGPYGAWFDVDWDFSPRVLLPVLGDDFHPERDLQVTDGELRYYEHRFPLAPGTFAADDPAAAVHSRQHYELVNFRRADAEQNYRRFFAVTELAGIRVEDPAVFRATHAEILRWVSDYGVIGIRIDHPDGLRDPGDYLAALRVAAPAAWITVEKITEPGEKLPAAWPVQGMTGYDALAEVNGVFVDPAAEAESSRIYQDVTGDQRSWEQQVQDGKRHVATTILQAEVLRLARLVPDVPQAQAALTELVVAFPVYRSYLPLGEHYLDEAVVTALARRPQLAEPIQALLPRLRDPADDLAARFQQVTGAVTAKGVEDTAYYRYNRLTSLNEVGGYPGTFGLSPADFHQAQRARLASAAQGMTTLSTHDTKRGEDIRARIHVLAEMPAQWRAAVSGLGELAPVPNRAFGYLLWQTIVATGFIDRDRLHAYAEKAMREASEGTRWIDSDEAFEGAVHAAVDAAYDMPAVREVIADLHTAIAPYAAVNSLSQKLVQLTMPGIPDVYQGSELLEDSLVDPDNRRPVDFAARRAALEQLDAAGRPAADLASRKLWLVSRALRARRDRAALFTGYTELPATGPAANHLLAFDRGGAITLASRLPVGLQQRDGWGTTTVQLPPGEYTDTLTGRQLQGSVELSDVLSALPVALLLGHQQ